MQPTIADSEATELLTKSQKHLESEEDIYDSEDKSEDDVMFLNKKSRPIAQHLEYQNSKHVENEVQYHHFQLKMSLFLIHK